MRAGADSNGLRTTGWGSIETGVFSEDVDATFCGEKLQGKLTAEAHVLGLVDHAHATATEPLKNAVEGDYFACHATLPSTDGRNKP